ncbi:hypothetical protein FRC07_008277 [Ceratobasidium sp. 392]|nr:hypothetical protein FRC07_008277 [Ceratobasidium sp. 392]
MLHDFANLVGKAISTPLEQVVRAVSQTPADGQVKPEIPASEKYSGKKGNTAKAFLIACPIHFVPAAVAVAERKINTLKQVGPDSDCFTEFTVLAGHLDWLIEHTIGRDIRTLDELITTTSLNDNTLYEARQESQGATSFARGSNASNNNNKSRTGRSSSFVPPKVRQKRRKAGHRPRCGNPAHKFEQCKNGWILKLSDQARQAASGKVAFLLDLEDTEV